MKHESAVQAVKELMRKDSVFRSVIQGWGVATLLIGLFMFYMGANTYIQSYKQTDWVFGSAYITDISELNRSKVGRGGINYSMTYEYEVDGTHYTGKYGPLANSIEVGTQGCQIYKTAAAQVLNDRNAAGAAKLH